MKELKDFNRYELLGLTQQDFDELDGYTVIDEETGEVASKEEIEKLMYGKNDKCMGFHKYCVENAEMFKAQAKKFADLAKYWEKKANSVAEAEKNFMLAVGKKKIVGPWGQATLRKSNVLEVTDEVKVMKLYDTNPEYFNVKVTPSKTELKKALKEGKDIEGVQLVQKENISIK